MRTTLEVLFTPAEFVTLAEHDLRRTTCVVFDVLRATSTIITALSNGAEAIIPVAEISEALGLQKRNPEVLLAGEREGLRIRSAQTGGPDFDLGNSPREFTAAKVQGRTIVITTTNGTRALRSCAHARRVLLGSFLNLRATAGEIAKTSPPHLLLICSGTFEQTAYEDCIAAGALCQLLWRHYRHGDVSDSAQIARRLFIVTKDDLLKAIRQSRNGKRLAARPELGQDIAYCAQLNSCPVIAELGRDGAVRSKCV